MEEWRPVVGWEQFYEVSSLGRVRGLTTGIIRSTHLNNSGYPCVTLSHRSDGTRLSATLTVHGLVASAFLIRPNTPCQVDHIDGTKTNARADNLEYVACGENHRRAYSLNLRRYTQRRTSHGSDRPLAKLTEDAVREIRNTPQFPGINQHFAKKFGVAFQTISAVRHGLLWKHVS